MSLAIKKHNWKDGEFLINIVNLFEMHENNYPEKLESLKKKIIEKFKKAISYTI